MPPPANRTRPATPTTRACPPQPSRRPRRGSRLTGLDRTGVLAAALGTRALADTDDGGGGWFVGSFGEGGGSQTDTAQSQAQGQQPGDQRDAVVTAGSENPDTQAAATEDERDHAGQDDSRGKAAACADDCSQQPPTYPVPRQLAAARPPDEPEGNPEENDAFNYFVEELAGRPLDQQLIEINGYLGRDELALQVIRDQPYDIDDRAERLRQQVVGALTFIDTVLQPQLKGALQSEPVAAQVAAARASAEELLRQIDEDLPAISAMTDPDAAREAAERSLMDSEIASMEEQVSHLVAARDQVGLEESLEYLKNLESYAQENEWPEQRAELLALQDSVHKALRDLQQPMSMVDPDTVTPGRQTTR